MDPLDPLTEIINSGDAFLFSIALERILWVIIGFFFIGAISTSITRGMKRSDWFSNNSFFSNLKTEKGGEDKLSKNLSDEDK